MFSSIGKVVFRLKLEILSGMIYNSFIVEIMMNLYQNACMLVRKQQHGGG